MYPSCAAACWDYFQSCQNSAEKVCVFSLIEGLCASQDVREGKAAQATFHGIMRDLLADVRVRAASGQLQDSSIAGHLLRLKQDGSSAGLADEVLLPEVGVFFFGGEVWGSIGAGGE